MAPSIDNLIGSDFHAEAINHKWCEDLTEIPTDEGQRYLATAQDLASRRLPGFAIGARHDAALVKAALCMPTTGAWTADVVSAALLIVVWIGSLVARHRRTPTE